MPWCRAWMHVDFAKAHSRRQCLSDIFSTKHHVLRPARRCELCLTRWSEQQTPWANLQQPYEPDESKQHVSDPRHSDVPPGQMVATAVPTKKKNTKICLNIWKQLTRNEGQGKQMIWETHTKKDRFEIASKSCCCFSRAPAKGLRAAVARTNTSTSNFSFYSVSDVRNQCSRSRPARWPGSHDGACANTSWRSSTRDEEPRTRIQKPRGKTLGGKRTAGTFLPFAGTENQCLSIFDSPSFRSHNKSHN